MKVLALDTGKKCFAWSLCSSKKGVVKTGMLENTITTLSDRFIAKEFRKFRIEFQGIRDLAIENKCEFIIAERFQSRPGMFGSGASAEYINVMIGVMGSMCRGRILFKTIMPSTWKSFFKRKIKSKEKLDAPELFGFKGVKKTTKTYPILEHQFDTFGIGLHSLEKRLDKDLKNVFKKSLKNMWNKHIKSDPKKYKGALNVVIN